MEGANPTVWLETSHDAAFASGGFAYVTAAGGALRGLVGGERTPSLERIALAGLAEAMKAAAHGTGLVIVSRARHVLAIPGRIAQAGDPPAEDLELWAPIATALKSRAVRFVRADQAGAPTAFVAAWAELARDKAKARGAFRAAIPRPNLAKSGI